MAWVLLLFGLGIALLGLGLVLGAGWLIDALLKRSKMD